MDERDSKIVYTGVKSTNEDSDSRDEENSSPEKSVVEIASNMRWELGVPARSSIERDTGIKISGRRINGCSLGRGTWRQPLN